jgi:hypothetical protein
MGETMVGLEGPVASLAEMSARFSSPRLTITDEGNGTGYLKSSEFPSSDDNAPIIEVAKQLLRIANGIMRLDDPLFFQPVSVGSIVSREDDGGKRTVTYSVPTATRVIASPLSESSQAPLEDIALDLLGEDAVVDALGFYSYRVNWAINLFKVYEIVGLDVEETKRGRKSTLSDNKGQWIQRGWNEIVKQGWATPDEVDRFTSTVHSSEILGDEARHAVQTKSVPANPMNEDEAKKFIGDVLGEWIRNKHQDPS